MTTVWNKMHSLHLPSSLITKPIRVLVYRLYYICEQLSMTWHEIASGRRAPSPVSHSRSQWVARWQLRVRYDERAPVWPRHRPRHRPSCPSSCHFHCIAAGIKPTIRSPSSRHCMDHPVVCRPLERCCRDGESPWQR